MTTCTTAAQHCESCGSTERGHDGYSLCCNELMTDAHDCRGYHMEED